MNASGGVPGCAMIQRSNDIKKTGQAMKTSCQLSYDHAKQYDYECSSHVYDDGSWMAIYLRMAMEMP